MQLGAFLNPLAKKYDRSGVLASIRALPAQCAQALRESAAIALPTAYRGAEQIVAAGMGGSGLGAHIIQTTFADALGAPFTIVNDYALPECVNRRTLVVTSSYSGTTEETLSAYDDARKRGAKIAVIAAGGALAARAQRDDVPAYIFKPTHNPSGQPRMAAGYLACGLLGLLRSARLVNISNADMDRAVAWCTALGERIERQSDLLDLARALVNRAPLLLAAEHLVGSAHAAQNQIHENAKHIAACFPLPEANHHLLEALRFPVGNRKSFHAIFFSTLTYHDRTQRRIALTRDIFKKHGISTTSIAVTGPNLFAESLTAILHGAYLAFALAMLHGLDPVSVPNVELFKKELTQK